MRLATVNGAHPGIGVCRRVCDKRRLGFQPDSAERQGDKLKAYPPFADPSYQKQVILSKDWRNYCEPIHLSGLKHLSISRPSIKDLILTKLMRIDPQDRDDIRKLMADASRQENWAESFASAKIPEIPEIKEAFRKNTVWFLGEFS